MCEAPLPDRLDVMTTDGVPEFGQRSTVNALVVLDVDCRDGVFELVLVNLGPGVATDIEVKFSERVAGVGDMWIDELPVWTRLKTLRPGKEIRILFDSTQRLRNDSACNHFTATTTWRAGGKRHAASYEHDLSAYAGLPQLVTGEAQALRVHAGDAAPKLR